MSGSPPPRHVAAGEARRERCPHCGSAPLHIALVKSTFWHEGRLTVVKDIPALVCDECGERQLEAATALALEVLQQEAEPREPTAAASDVVIVSFAHRIPAGLEVLAERQG